LNPDLEIESAKAAVADRARGGAPRQDKAPSSAICNRMEKELERPSRRGKDRAAEKEEPAWGLKSR